MHGSTFGGNPLASVVGIEALKVLKEEKLVENSKELGAYLLERLKSLRSPAFVDIRGKGLWVGLEIDPKRISARKFCERLMSKGVLAKETHEVVVRLAPPLTITKSEIDWAIDQIKAVLEEMSG